MTPQPPHPQRCTTCKDESCEFHKSKRAISIMGCPVSNVVHEFTAEKGCASHSSAGAQQRIEQAIKILQSGVEVSESGYDDDGENHSLLQEDCKRAIALLQVGDGK